LGSKWLTPKEVAKTLGPEKCRKLLDDLVYNRRTRREIVEAVMQEADCTEYSATDFLRELTQNPEFTKG